MIEQLLADASRIAEEYRYDRVEAEHLLFVLLRQASARSQLESLGLDSNEVLSNLVAGFRHHRQRSAPHPSRLIVSDQVIQTLEMAEGFDGIRIEPVLDLLKTTSTETGAMITSEKSFRARSTEKTDLLLREPLPDLDELLDGLEQGDIFSGFDRICEEVFDGPRVRQKRSETTALMDGGRRVGEESGKSAHEETRGGREHQHPPKPSLSEKERTEALRAVERSIRDLTSLYAQGSMDPILGRDREIDQVCEVLMRRRKSNVLLVGEPGVGKTALMEGVAARVAVTNDPALSGRPVLQASLGALVAGARYRGDFEIRMELLIELAADRNAILFFDEMQMLIGSGATAERGMDGANLLKPALARDGLSLVGATTHDEMDLIRSDAALMRRFELINVREPRAEIMRDILRGAAAPYLSHHRLISDDRILDRIVDFADAYLPDRRFPDKAFDVLDSACVRARLAGRRSIMVGDIRDAIRRLGGTLPDIDAGSNPNGDQKAIRDRLASALKKRVAGHPEAIEALSDLIAYRRSGKPLTVLLDGPSGVGRRTVSLALASELELRPVEVFTSSGPETARAHLIPAFERYGPLLVVLNMDSQFEGGAEGFITSMMSKDISKSSLVSSPNLSNSIFVIRKKIDQESYGFSMSNFDKRESLSDISYVKMSTFRGERVNDCISFELSRLAGIWSDSGCSRPIPSVNEVLKITGPGPLLWKDISEACIKAAHLSG
jgi:ATP-dependent Clp protease ATP-binding subunit ClpA